MTNRPLITLIASGAIASTGSVATGQDAQASEAGITPPPTPSTSLAFETLGMYLDGADVDGSTGDVDIARLGATLRFRHSLSEALTLTGSFRHEWSDYDFEQAAGLFTGASNAETPFDAVSESGITLGLTAQLDDQWSLFANGVIGAGYESGADFGDSIFGGGFGGFGYRFTDDFSMTLGVGALTRLEDDALVIPLIGFRWQIQDDLRLESEGISTRLVWEANDDLELSAFGRYSSRDYRMDDDNPYLPEGAFSDNRIVIGAAADWQVAERFTLKLEAGASVWQEYKFFNSSGDELSTRETDPQLMLRAGFEFRF